MVEYSVGIDLGTTYSCLAYADTDGELKILKMMDENNSMTMPSVVYFWNPEEYVVGYQAKNASEEDLGRKEAVKRDMGSTTEYDIFGRKYNPQTISAMILKEMIDEFNRQKNTKLKKAVISVPNHFSGSARQATIDAGKIAGLEEVILIDEPVSASICYGLNNRENRGTNIVVYDLGGGTFDSTVLRIENDGMLNTLSTNGAQDLGGLDWDKRLFDLLVKKLMEDDMNMMDEDTLRRNPEIRHNLMIKAEEIKKRLTDEFEVEDSFFIDPFPIGIKVTREEFDDITVDLLQKTINIMQSAIDHAGLDIEDISKIVCVGGSSNMPQIREMISETYPNMEIELYEPDHAIAKGDAIFATTLANNPQEQTTLSEIDDVPEVHTVLSKTYGTEAEIADFDNRVMVSNIIFRNQSLPCENERCYHPTEDNVDSIWVTISENEVYEEEEDSDVTPLERCNKLGEFVVKLPRDMKKKDNIFIKFVATLDGRLIAMVDIKNRPIEKYELRITNSMTSTEISTLRIQLSNMKRSGNNGNN